MRPKPVSRDITQSLRKTFLHLWGWNHPRTHLPLKGLTTFQHSHTKRKASSPITFRRQTMSNPQQHQTSSPLNPEETKQFWMSLHYTKRWQLSFTAVELPCCSCLIPFLSGWTGPLSAPSWYSSSEPGLTIKRELQNRVKWLLLKGP